MRYIFRHYVLFDSPSPSRDQLSVVQGLKVDVSRISPSFDSKISKVEFSNDVRKELKRPSLMPSHFSFRVKSGFQIQLKVRVPERHDTLLLIMFRDESYFTAYYMTRRREVIGGKRSLGSFRESCQLLGRNGRSPRLKRRSREEKGKGKRRRDELRGETSFSPPSTSATAAGWGRM